MDLIKIRAALKIDEGRGELPFIDSEGFLTWGYGLKISNRKGLDADVYCMEMPEEVASLWMNIELDKKIDEIKSYRRIELALQACESSPARYYALVSMSYQIGAAGLNLFKGMLGATIEHDWKKAHDEALDSKWAVQTPNRAKRLAKQMLTGEWDSYYLTT